MITCKECEARGVPLTFKAITHRHLKIQHNMVLDEYIERWPGAPLRDNRMVELPTVVDESCKELIGTLRPIEQEYIAARLNCGTKDAAARSIGLAPSTIYNWKARLLVEAIIGYIQADNVIKGMMLLNEAIPEAAQNIRDLQYSADERVALSASREILERAGVRGKKSEPTIDITIYSEMPPDVLDGEIAKLLAQEQTVEIQGRVVNE